MAFSAETKYESLENFTENRFKLNDDKLTKCMENLHCSAVSIEDKGYYSTWTSQWARVRRKSYYAYSLLKVKRWHLVQENFIFDPLKRRDVREIEIKPSNTLWSTFEQPHLESQWSVDGIIATFLAVDENGLNGLMEFESILHVLDRSTDLIRTTFKLIKNRSDFFAAYPFAVHPCTEFIVGVSSILQKFDENRKKMKKDKITEGLFEEMFSCLVQCVAACIHSRTSTVACCKKSVTGVTLDKYMLEANLRDVPRKSLYLEITSIPDLFIYARESDSYRNTVLAVVEVKVKHGDRIEHSEDEDCHTPGTPSKPSLSTLYEDDEDDDESEYEYDDGDDENDMEKLIRRPPPWLKSIKTLPYSDQQALKKFLPQLIGEMYTVARCENLIPLKMADGLLIGIGVIGFDIYFVSMMDSCRDSPKSVVNDDGAFTQVFLTRGFNLLVKQDRRIILKMICAILLLPLE